MSNNPFWNAVTAGQLSLAIEALGEAIKDRHAQGANEEELAALGEVHRALYHERRARINATLAAQTPTWTRRRRRNIR